MPIRVVSVSILLLCSLQTEALAQGGRGPEVVSGDEQPARERGTEASAVPASRALDGPVVDYVSPEQVRG